MRVNIVNVTNASDDEWDEIWRYSEVGTYYHSREWTEIWQLYSNNRVKSLPKLILFSDGKKVVLPIMLQNYYCGFIKRFGITGPPSEVKVKYGNWLTSDKLANDHIKLLLNYLTDNYRNLVWRLNPFDEDSKKINVHSKYIRRKPFFVYMIDLTRGEDYIFANMKQSCRNKIKQGIKNNLIVKEGVELQDWVHYYSIYQDTINRWGGKTLYMFGWEFFELLYKKCSNYIKLWTTLYDNKPISGCIGFYSQKKIIMFQSSSLSEYRHLRPANFEKYFLIKDGIEKGYKWLDLGTAGSNRGLANFKKSFGAEEIMCDMFISWHPIIFNVKKLLNS